MLKKLMVFWVSVLELSVREEQSCRLGSNGVLLWCLLRRNSKGKCALRKVVWDIREDLYLTVIE